MGFVRERGISKVGYLKHGDCTGEWNDVLTYVAEVRGEDAQSLGII